MLSEQFYTLSQIRHLLILPNTFAIHFPSCCGRKYQSLEGKQNIAFVYGEAQRPFCKFGISDTFTIPSPFSLGPASLPPFAPISPRISSLAARQELQILCRAKPLPSPAQDEWHRSSSSNTKPGVFAKRPTANSVWAASRHTLCAVFYSWLGSPSAAKVQTCMQTWFLFKSCQPPLDNNFYPPAEWVFIMDIQCRLVFEIFTS